MYPTLSLSLSFTPSQRKKTINFTNTQHDAKKKTKKWGKKESQQLGLVWRLGVFKSLVWDMKKA